jgi:hypothetical protein
MPASLNRARNEQHAESTEVTLARDAKTESFGTKVYKIPQKTDWRSTFFGSKLMKTTVSTIRNALATSDGSGPRFQRSRELTISLFQILTGKVFQ